MPDAPPFADGPAPSGAPADLDPAFLLLPGPGDPDHQRFSRKVRLLALRGLLLGDPRGLDRGSARALDAARAALADAARLRPDPLLRALGEPDVLAPLLCWRAGLIPAARAVSAVPALLLHAARAGALPQAVLWDAPLAELPDPELGLTWADAAPFSGLLAAPEGVELRRSSGELVRLDRASAARLPVRMDFPAFAPTLLPGVHLGLRDSNPLADQEAHPDKSGNAISLGGVELARWQAAMDEALGLVQAGLPGWFAALPGALRRVVPVGFEPERHLSASYREAPGLVYLTLHPSALTLAEAVVHEVQHGRLNTLLLLDPVFHNGRTAWTPSPVRPDLRPLEGVLLAVHAFVPVAWMHARLAALGHPVAQTAAFAARRAQVLAGNARGLQICEELAQPTDAGARLLTALRRVHAACAEAHPGDPVPETSLPSAPGGPLPC
jgi:HEXXH motif-containing protein